MSDKWASATQATGAAGGLAAVAAVFAEPKTIKVGPFSYEPKQAVSSLAVVCLLVYLLPTIVRFCVWLYQWLRKPAESAPTQQSLQVANQESMQEQDVAQVQEAKQESFQQQESAQNVEQESAQSVEQESKNVNKNTQNVYVTSPAHEPGTSSAVDIFGCGWDNGHLVMATAAATEEAVRLVRSSRCLHGELLEESPEDRVKYRCSRARMVTRFNEDLKRASEFDWLSKSAAMHAGGLAQKKTIFETYGKTIGDIQVELNRLKIDADKVPAPSECPETQLAYTEVYDRLMGELERLAEELETVIDECQLVDSGRARAEAMKLAIAKKPISKDEFA